MVFQLRILLYGLLYLYHFYGFVMGFIIMRVAWFVQAESWMENHECYIRLLSPKFSKTDKLKFRLFYCSSFIHLSNTCMISVYITSRHHSKRVNKVYFYAKFCTKKIITFNKLHHYMYICHKDQTGNKINLKYNDSNRNFMCSCSPTAADAKLITSIPILMSYIY